MQLPSAPDFDGSTTLNTPVALFTQPWNNNVPVSGMAAEAIPTVAAIRIAAEKVASTIVRCVLHSRLLRARAVMTFLSLCRRTA
jgi:hypothetical protein